MLPARQRRRSTGGDAVVRPTAIEEWFVVAAVLVYMGAFTSTVYMVTSAGRLMPGSVNPVNTLAQTAVLVGVGIFLITHRKIVWPPARAAWLFVAFIMLCALSSAWSGFPELALRRSFSLAACFLFGFYVAAVFSPTRLFVLITRAAMIAAVASLLLFATMPAIGREPLLAGHPLRGVFAQKNVIASELLPALICYLYFWQAAIRPFRQIVLGVAAVLACLLLSNSAMGLGIAAAMFLLAAFFRSSRIRHLPIVLLIIALLLLVIVATFLLAAPDSVFGLIGRDPTFTGRSAIWQLAAHYIAQRPLLGYGYASFWNVGDNASKHIFYSIGWVTPDAHNGYLDLALQLGLVGGTLGVLLLLRTLLGAVRALKQGYLPEAQWIIMIVVMIAASNFVQSDLMALGFNSSVLLAICGGLLEHRRRLSQPEPVTTPHL